MNPTVHLSIDTCFASKRWPMPRDWAPIVADLGIRYVELGADTEADPMYHGDEYLRDWDDQVAEECARNGLRVASLYSGHGSYGTMGLLHPDERIVRRMIDSWLKPTIRRAAFHGADLGFFFHAVAEADLHDSERYARVMRTLALRLTEGATEAKAHGVRLALEQMYSPNQPPWTIEGSRELMRTVTASGSPLYITVDTGHASAQHRFAGSQAVDSDPYAWLRAVGPYSPVIHLQQTDGTVSGHRPFTDETNGGGIIAPDAVLRALHAGFASAEAEPDAGLPPVVDSLYLTLEVFAPTAQPSEDLLQDLADSAAHWRRWIPEDGRRLNDLVAAMSGDAR